MARESLLIHVVVFDVEQTAFASNGENDRHVSSIDRAAASRLGG
jgi:hypothetical protein